MLGMTKLLGGVCPAGDGASRSRSLAGVLGYDEGSLAERLARPLVPLSQDLGRSFLYVRYNLDLSDDGLRALGLPGQVDPARVRKMDKADSDHIQLLLEIGARAARHVAIAHFGPFAP